MKKVRVLLWGLGMMGSGIARALLQRDGIEISAAIDSNPALSGRSLAEVLGEGDAQLPIASGPEGVVLPGAADLAIVAVASFTRDVFPHLKRLAEAGMDVITIAEEMAYPAAQNPELATELDRIARENGVTILGTGINPGFVLDALIIALTGVCLDVQEIRATRINDLSPFGRTVMETQGVGTTPDQFAAGIADGSIVGHVGFPESMSLVAAALGWELDKIVQTKEPIISNVPRETPHVRIEPGMVAGCRHVAHGYKDGQIVITMEHPQQVRPEAENVETGDYIWIRGTPDLNLSIKPEIPGGIGTMAMAVNMIPQVINASPGLKTMKDLPLPAAWLTDVRAWLQTRSECDE
ncbi:MAG: 2,4-diaminopentanoate dehydrogenase [Bacillota bacterium]